MANPLRQIFMGLNYVLRRKGLLGWWAGLAGAFVKTRNELDRPNVQLALYPFSTTAWIVLPAPLLGIHTECLSTSAVFAWSRSDQKPRSSCRSRNLPELSSDFRDAEVTAAGMKIARKVAAAEPLASMIKSEMDPGPATQSDEEFLKFLRAKAMSVYHPVGTCRMGRDENAVVDDQLRVHGVVGLRVVDASIMPTLISGNTNAPSIMIGEMGAELVLRAAALRNAKAA